MAVPAVQATRCASAGEQRDAADRPRVRAAIGWPGGCIAASLLAARFLDVGSDRVEFAAEVLDVLGRQVGVFLDVSDSHVGLLSDLDGAVAGCGGDAGLNAVALAVLGARAEVADMAGFQWQTQVWQMPMRHPNGIWMPAFSPASSSEVAPSTSTVLSEIAKVTVPPSPPLSVRAMTKRSMCRWSSGHRRPARPFRSHRAWPAARTPRSAVLPVRDEPVELRRSRGARLSRSAASAARSDRGPLESRCSSSWKITSCDGAEWMCTMSGVLPRCAIDRSIAMTGVMPLPAVTNSTLRAAGRAGRSPPWVRPGERSFPAHTVHQVGRQEALGRRLDGDRDDFLSRTGTEVNEYERQCHLPSMRRPMPTY